MTAKTVNILGSTGSIGINTLNVIRSHREHFKVAGLAAGANSEVLKQQIAEFKPSYVYVRDEVSYQAIRNAFGDSIKVFNHDEGLRVFSQAVDADILVAATSGTTSLLSVLDTLEKGKRVALANKEILVMAGQAVMQALKRHPEATLIPVDSEHSAIFQCLQGGNSRGVSKLVLTGTGGPLREVSYEEFRHVTKERVINHPKWKMGKKISVDSATLMNKGLEIIEASWLFDLPIDKIEVLIHPEAVIHSMVEFKDGSLLAQLGVTDMRLPIQYALSYPERLEVESSLKLDWAKHSQLTFAEPDTKKFPCLELAYSAARMAGSAPCVLSAADEVAVNAYLEDLIPFMDIPRIIEKVLTNHKHVVRPDLNEIQSIHNWAVEETKRFIGSDRSF